MHLLSQTWSQTLISTGLVETVGEGDSTGGRPPDILRFRAEHGCVAGVEITRDTLRFLLADLNGRELARSETLLRDHSPRRWKSAEQISKKVRKLLRTKNLMGSELAGLNVGVPAIVNVDEGTVVALSALRNWNDVPLRSMLTRELKCPGGDRQRYELGGGGRILSRSSAAGERLCFCHDWRRSRAPEFFWAAAFIAAPNGQRARLDICESLTISRERPDDSYLWQARKSALGVGHFEELARQRPSRREFDRE